MRSVLRYGGLFGAALVLFLLLLAPAHLVTTPMLQRWPDLHLQQSNGSLVHGSADALRWREVQVQRLSWTWQPLELLSAWLAVRVTITDPNIKLVGMVARNFQRELRGQQLRGRLPLADVARLAGHPPWPAQGMVEFDLPVLRLDAHARPQQAAGTVRVVGLQITLGSALPLGDYSMQLRTAETGGIQGSFSADHHAPLALQGTLNLAVDGSYTCSARLAVRDPQQQALRHALTALLGQAGADGHWTMQFAGSIP